MPRSLGRVLRIEADTRLRNRLLVEERPLFDVHVHQIHDELEREVERELADKIR